MQHSWGSKDNHWSWIINVGPVKCLDMLEFEHVSLYKCIFNLLTSPCDKQLVVVVGLKRKVDDILYGTKMLIYLTVFYFKRYHQDNMSV